MTGTLGTTSIGAVPSIPQLRRRLCREFSRAAAQRCLRSQPPDLAEDDSHRMLSWFGPPDAYSLYQR